MRLLVLLVLLVVCGQAAPASAADWRWPLDGPPSVSRPFDAPASRYAAGHRGADLPAAPGAPVRAAGDGWVSYAGLVAGRGVVVVVHGPLRTTYEPVTALVEVLAPVTVGEVLGVLEPGHLGCPAPACLHWGLRRGDAYLDPVRLVRPGPVRLLPVAGPDAVGGGRASGVGETAGRVAGPAEVRPPVAAVPRSATEVGAMVGASGAGVGTAAGAGAAAAVDTRAGAASAGARAGAAAGAAALLGAVAVRAARRRGG